MSCYSVTHLPLLLFYTYCVNIYHTSTRYQVDALREEIRIAKSKFNELQFYIIFFVIFLLISNLGTSQMMRQETSTGTMPVVAVLTPALVQLSLVFLIIWAAKSEGNSLLDIGFKTYSW